MIERFGKNEIDAVVKSINKSSLLSGYTNKFLGGETLQKFEKEFAKAKSTFELKGFLQYMARKKRIL